MGRSSELERQIKQKTGGASGGASQKSGGPWPPLRIATARDHTFRTETRDLKNCYLAFSCKFNKRRFKQFQDVILSNFLHFCHSLLYFGFSFTEAWTDRTS